MAGKLRDDFTGRRFGRLVVLRREPRPPEQKHYVVRWACRCDCGEERVVFATALRQGATVSCGCVRRERAKENIKKAQELPVRGPVTHGRTGTAEWRTWCDIKKRCTNKANHAYPYYGGRGITVCERWSRFESFLADMGERPPKHTLDRIDNNGPYSPDNCRWATRKEQARNRRSNVRYTARGLTLTLSEWSERLGIKRTTLSRRILDYGWTVEEALK